MPNSSAVTRYVLIRPKSEMNFVGTNTVICQQGLRIGITRPLYSLSVKFKGLNFINIEKSVVNFQV